jgi:hypothetical protein
LGEHRNDHQIATAKRFAEQERIVVAANEQELLEALDELGTNGDAERISAQASSHLITTIRAFINTGTVHSESGELSTSGEPARR